MNWENFKISSWKFFEMCVKLISSVSLFTWKCQNSLNWRWPYFRTVQVESTPHNPSMFPFLYCLFISWATFHPPSRLPLCRDSRPDFCWQWGFLVCVVILCNERLRLGQFVLFIFSWHCLTQTLKNSPLTEKWRGVYQIKSEQDSWQIKSKNFPILSLSMHRIHTHTLRSPAVSRSLAWTYNWIPAPSSLPTQLTG